MDAIQKSRNLTKEQKILQKQLLGVVLYFKNLNGETTRTLSTDYNLSVGTTSNRIREGKGYVATNPEITLEGAEELLSRVHIENEEEISVRRAEMSVQREAIRMVYEKATGSVGIKGKEEYALYSQLFGHALDGKCVITPQQKSYVRRRVREIAKANGLQALFVPDWFNTDTPQRSLTTMMNMAHCLYERVEEIVDEYIYTNQLPSTARYAVKQALMGIVVEGVNLQSVERQCSNYSDIVCALTDNGVHVRSHDAHHNGVPALGVHTREQVVQDCVKEWEERTHSLFSMPNGQCEYRTNVTAAEIRSVYEAMEDLDEKGYIY